MKKVTAIFTILILAITFTSCSSDDNTAIAEDYTNEDILREILVGTWDATHLKDNGKWIELDRNESFTFNNSGTYTYESINEDGELDLNLSGDYKIHPATEINNATIDLYTSGVKAPLYLILKSHNKGIAEIAISTSSGSFDFKFKKR